MRNGTRKGTVSGALALTPQLLRHLHPNPGGLHAPPVALLGRTFVSFAGVDQGDPAAGALQGTEGAALACEPLIGLDQLENVPKLRCHPTVAGRIRMIVSGE